MRKTVVPLIAVVSLTSTASARIGETLDQCKERYGRVLEERLPKGGFAFPSYSFEANGLKITAIMIDGKVASMIYVSPKALDRSTIEALLERNGNGSQWSFDEAASKKEASTVVQNTQVYRRQDGGAEATYQEVGAYHGLQIVSAAFKSATRPELKRL